MARHRESSGLTSSEGEIRPGDRRRSRRPEPTPIQCALVLLIRREHSGRELVRKLVAHGVSEDEAEQAIARLTGAGWQDDTRFAEALVRARARAGYGPIRIRADLSIHGLDQDTMTAAMESFEGDWSAYARDLVCRRFSRGIVQDRVVQRKAADFLFRRGFTAAHVRAAVRIDTDDGL